MSKTQIDAPAGVPFVDITREFDAPLALVRRAWTDPDLVKQWLGPRKYEMVIEQWDARAGGAYRYIHRDDAGNEFGFHGVFHSSDPDNMVQTFEFEGMPGHVSSRPAPARRYRWRTHPRIRSLRLPVARGPRRHGPGRDGRRRQRGLRAARRAPRDDAAARRLTAQLGSRIHVRSAHITRQQRAQPS